MLARRSGVELDLLFFLMSNVQGSVVFFLLPFCLLNLVYIVSISDTLLLLFLFLSYRILNSLKSFPFPLLEELLPLLQFSFSIEVKTLVTYLAAAMTSGNRLADPTYL